MSMITNTNHIRLKLDFIKGTESFLLSYVSIVLMLDGSMEITTLNEKTILQNGDIFVVNPGVIHDFHSDKESLIFRIFIPLDVFGDPPRLTAFDCNTAAMKSRHDEGLLSLLNQILLAFLNSQNYEQDLGHVYTDLLDYLARFYPVRVKKSHNNNGRDLFNERISQVIQYVLCNYEQPLTLNYVSDQLHLSYSYLSRYFKKEFGVNFKEYLTRLRINHAAEDLIYSQDSVLNVALNNGFTNLNVFNKTFFEIYQATPSKYRESMTGKIREQVPLYKDAEDLLRLRLAETASNLGETSLNHAITGEVSLNKAVPSSKPWKAMLNAGTVNDLLNPSVQKQLLFLKQELGFHYVRFWGVYPEAAPSDRLKKNGFYFGSLEQAISFLLENNLKPFFLFGPKTRAIIDADGKHSVPGFESASYKDVDADCWRDYLESFMRYFGTRYGKQEISNWIFELWHPCPWDSPWENWYTDGKYEIFYQIIKKHAPSALVGGCEYVRQTQWQTLHQSAEYWRVRNIIPDFISFHLFLNKIPDIENDCASDAFSENSYFEREIRAMRRLLAECRLDKAKLFLSLWGLTTSNLHYLNDTCLKGAWMVKTLPAMIGLVDMAGYWLASDLFISRTNSGPMLFGGAGMITSSGILKPAFYALNFLNRTLDMQVGRNENFLITTDSYGNCTIVFHNLLAPELHALNGGIKYASDDWQYAFSLSEEPVKFSLHLHPITPGAYYVRKSTVSPEYGSIFDEWKRWNYPDRLRREDYRYLRKRCIPLVDISVKEIEDVSLTLEFDVLPNEFGLIEIYPYY